MGVRLAAFPKCYLDALVVDRTMSWLEWVARAARLPHVEGVECYPYALDSLDPAYLERVRAATEERGLIIPMMCASPDFTQISPERRQAEIERYTSIIDATAALGGHTCRILSGQRRPGVRREDGIDWVVAAIESLLPRAAERKVMLVMENHYKDGFWEYAEFAQARDVFLAIVERIDSPHFGVNYDPSNALIAGEDPIELLDTVKHRVVSMHASDRSLEGGTLEDLRFVDADPAQGYAPFIKHGVIGKGLIDYDRIFQILASVGFSGWISIEDGQDPTTGMKDLRDSAEFLHSKMQQHGLT